VTRAASNCGEFQRERKDPFDLVDANFVFYNDFAGMEFISQKIVARVEFPVFKKQPTSQLPQESSSQPVSNEDRAVDSLTGSLNAVNLSQEAAGKKKSSANENESLTTSRHVNFSTIDTASQGTVAQKSSPQTPGGQNQSSLLGVTASNSHNMVYVNVSSTNDDGHVCAANGMIHSNSPLGALPLFSSWSLVSIGKYSDYNVHTGWFIIVIIFNR
jgi:hypothetical protein